MPQSPEAEISLLAASLRAALDGLVQEGRIERVSSTKLGVRYRVMRQVVA